MRGMAFFIKRGKVFMIKNKKKDKRSSKIIWILVALLVVVIAICCVALKKDDQNPNGLNTINNVELEKVEEISMNLGHGMEIINLGSYTGAFVEDGTDEQVADVMMIVVHNTGEEYIQYAEITVAGDNGDASFLLSTLPPNASVLLLEQNRMNYDENITYSSAVAENVAVFIEPVSLQDDKLSIQALDGALNATNVSGEDITGDIYIYYKNSSVDMYYGGITYRAKVEGGMAADEIRQVMTNHFSAEGSTIMFVTIAGE